MIWASNSGGRQISHISQMQAKEERSSKILFEFFCSQRQRYSIFAIHCFSETPPRSEQMTSKRISLDRFSCPTSEAISIKWCAFFQCTRAAAYVALGSTERCAVQWCWRFRPPKTINLSSSVRGRRNPNLFDPLRAPHMFHLLRFADLRLESCEAYWRSHFTTTQGTLLPLSTRDERILKGSFSRLCWERPSCLPSDSVANPRRLLSAKLDAWLWDAVKDDAFPGPWHFSLTRVGSREEFKASFASLQGRSLCFTGLFSPRATSKFNPASRY